MLHDCLVVMKCASHLQINYKQNMDELQCVQYLHLKTVVKIIERLWLWQLNSGYGLIESRRKENIHFGFHLQSGVACKLCAAEPLHGCEG